MFVSGLVIFCSSLTVRSGPLRITVQRSWCWQRVWLPIRSEPWKKLDTLSCRAEIELNRCCKGCVVRNWRCTALGKKVYLLLPTIYRSRNKAGRRKEDEDRDCPMYTRKNDEGIRISLKTRRSTKMQWREIFTEGNVRPYHFASNILTGGISVNEPNLGWSQGKRAS